MYPDFNLFVKDAFTKLNIFPLMHLARYMSVHFQISSLVWNSVNDIFDNQKTSIDRRYRNWIVRYTS